MSESADTVEIIREAFRYTQVFRGKTFVLQVEDIIADDSALSSLVRDLSLLLRTGIHIVLVAGARRRIDEILNRYAVNTEKHNGIRISTPQAIPFIKMAAFDAANRIMTSLSAAGINAVIGNWVRARSLGVVDGVDYEDAGAVDRVRADLIRSVFEQGSIPILPCIGWSASGKPYNVSSRELATMLAISLEASKLFFVTGRPALSSHDYRVEPPVEAGPDGRISRMNLDQAGSFVDLNTNPDDPGVERVQLAIEAARKGVERVHLVDGSSDGSVLREIFSNLGVGTMVYTDEYQSIRSMRRTDAADVHRLMRPMMSAGFLVARNEVDLADGHEDFVVFETDGMVHGCGALHVYESNPPGSAQGEIAGLAVDPVFDDLGIGKRIVAFLLDRARALGISRVFALTTQASDWFEQVGFKPGALSEVPGQKQSVYDHGRKSRVVIKDL